MTKASERKAINAFWRKKFLWAVLLFTSIGFGIAIFNKEFIPSEGERKLSILLVQWAGVWAFTMAIVFHISEHFRIRKKIKTHGLTMSMFVNLSKDEQNEIQ